MNWKQRLAIWLYPELGEDRKIQLRKLLEQKHEIRQWRDRAISAEEAFRNMNYLSHMAHMKATQEHDQKYGTMLSWRDR